MHKTCSVCSKSKHLSEFHCRKGSEDGYYGSCKECRRAYNQERYERKRTQILESKKLYWIENKQEITKKRKTPRRLELQRQRYKLYRSIQSEAKKKSKAGNVVNRAIRKNQFPDPKTCICVKCGSPAIEYHHHSYEPEFWFDVVPICRKCHTNIHTGRKTPNVPEDPNWGRKRKNLSTKQLEVLQRNKKPRRAKEAKVAE